LGIVLIGLTQDVSAAPIGLDNDVDLDWSDSPCLLGDPPGAAPLCEQDANGQWRLKPAEELIQILGAARLVPDASNAGDLLLIAVDFLDVSLVRIDGAPHDGATPLILNVYDVNLNPFLVNDVPLQLTYYIPPSCCLNTESVDLSLRLGEFENFNLLPQGDLIFTVSFDPRLALTDRSSTRPDHVVEIRFSGPGTTEAPDPEPVPEPGTLVLLLSGLAASGLGAARRRRR
jgi:hypothetical protein